MSYLCLFLKMLSFNVYIILYIHIVNYVSVVCLLRQTLTIHLGWP